MFVQWYFVSLNRNLIAENSSVAKRAPNLMTRQPVSIGLWDYSQAPLPTVKCAQCARRASGSLNQNPAQKCRKLSPYDFDQHPLSAATVELAVKNLLPRSKVQFAFGNGYNDFTAHNLAFHMGVGIILACPVVLVL